MALCQVDEWLWLLFTGTSVAKGSAWSWAVSVGGLIGGQQFLFAHVFAPRICAYVFI